NLRDLREPRRHVLDRGELDLEHGEQTRPLLLLRVDRRERRCRSDVLRLDGEHALPDLARLLQRIVPVVSPGLRPPAAYLRILQPLVRALLRELRRALDERQARRLRVEAV